MIRVLVSLGRRQMIDEAYLDEARQSQWGSILLPARSDTFPVDVDTRRTAGQTMYAVLSVCPRCDKNRWEVRSWLLETVSRQRIPSPKVTDLRSQR